MGDTAVLEATRRVVAKCAPEELVILETSAFPPGPAPRTGSGPLGFGLEVAVAALSPLIYKFFEALFTEMGKNSGGKLGEHVASVFNDKHRALSQDAIAAHIRRYLEAHGVDEARIESATEAIMSELPPHGR